MVFCFASEELPMVKPILDRESGKGGFFIPDSHCDAGA